MTMRRIGISQDVPNQGKRTARIAAAAARIGQSEAVQQATARMLRLEVARAWLKRYNIEQQLAQIALLQTENQRFAKVLQAQLGSGRGNASDAVLARQEAAMRAEHSQKLAQDWAELEHLGHVIERTRRVFRPLAQKKVELALASFQSGKGLLLEVMAARREALKLQLKQIMQEGEQDLLAAQILLTYQNETGAQP